MIKWFLNNYPEYVTKMRNCSYHTDSYKNLHHLEGDVWSHTMLSYSNGINNNVSEVVLLALLLHDIGRVYTREEDKKEKSVSFGYFEGVSCYVALDILNNLELSESQKISILKIIMHQYTIIDFVKYDDCKWEEFVNKFKYDEELLKNLLSYVKCDLFGRIIDNSKKKYYDLEKIQQYEKKASVLEQTIKEKKSSSKKELYILIGLPCSGKTTWIETNHKNAYIVSRDLCIDTIGQKYNVHNHDDAYTLQDENEDISNEVDNLYSKRSDESFKTSEVVIIDNLNLKTKIRANIIDKYKDTHNIHGVLFLKSFQNIVSCDESRSISEKKTIGYQLIIKHLKKFQFPLLNEGFCDIEYIF